MTFQQPFEIKIKAEHVAYWFFRLNGCLTITNFIIHPDLIRRNEPRSQRTDVDILAVRFPYRCELFKSGNPMVDHDVFLKVDKRIDIIMAEVKSGRCNLNGPWRNEPDENMHRVLYAIGAFPEFQVPKVAKALYRDCYYEDDFFVVRLFAIGKERNDRLPPKVVQLTWQEVLEFIYERFNKYREHKAQHEQWDNVGKALYSWSIRKDKDLFVQTVMNDMFPNRQPSEGC